MTDEQWNMLTDAEKRRCYEDSRMIRDEVKAENRKLAGFIKVVGSGIHSESFLVASAREILDSLVKIPSVQ